MLYELYIPRITSYNVCYTKLLRMSLLLQKHKGISVAGNFFSLASVIILLTSINILSHKVDITYKYIQGFYSIFAFLIFGVLYSSRRIIILNLLLVVATTTHVFFRSLEYFPERADMYTAAYINHTFIVIAVTLVVFYSKKFIGISIAKAEQELKEKELKNQELLTSEEEIRASNEELKATTDRNNFV